MSKTLLLLDATAHLYRTFYAIRPLTDPHGRPVQVAYGFAHTWMNLLEKIKPTHAVAVFDRPEPTQRHMAFPAYKAQRQETPEGLVGQIPLVKELLQSFQLAVYEQAGWEADDIIATLATRGQQAGFEVLVFTSDKDLFQIVGGGVKILRPLRGGKGECEILDEIGVKNVFGVAPEQVVEVLGLMGDASDNIPGVPGVGEKTAVDLITAFGSIQNLYASLAQVTKAKLKAILIAHREEAERCRQLVTIMTNVPMEFTWEQCQVPVSVPASAFDFMAGLGFKSLLAGKETAAPVAGWAQGLEGNADLKTVLAQAEKNKLLCMEVMSDGLAMAAGPQTAAWIPFGEGGLAEAIEAGPAWIKCVCDPDIKKVAYDLKPLETALLKAGLRPTGPRDDLHVCAHLLDLPATRSVDFITRLLGGAPPQDRPGLTACALLLIHRSIYSRLKEQGAERVYAEIEMPLLPVLAGMEAVGVAIDSGAWETMSVRLGLELQRLEKEIQALAGIEFNIRSTQQLAEVLFNRLHLSPGKKTKTGHSTSVEVLEMLASQHPLPAKVLEFRQLQKLKSTYLDVLPTLLDPKDRRVHTTFNQVGTATGRLSSSDPNLQNIPIRTELGRELRRMFVPGDKSAYLLSADYSQIELRLLAHFSEDEQMVMDFTAGLDIHRATAANIFNVSPEQVTPDMRRMAKTCNFGIAYGVTPFGLARQLGVSPGRAREFIDGFYQRYPKVREFLNALIAGARENGYVGTFFGRRRMLPDIHSANRNIREAAERMAINMPVQGSAADLIKLAMVKIAEELKQKSWQSRMILQVHDELLFEGPETEMEALQAMVVSIMSRIYPLKVELAVEAAWGKNWMEAH